MARKLYKQKRTAKKQKVKKPIASGKSLSAASRVSSLLDEKILALASDRYVKILKQINIGKKRINDERRTALLIGQRILERAMSVRNQLVQKAPLSRLKRSKSRKQRPQVS